jgi:demethylspheroidene O-methyltransferase
MSDISIGGPAQGSPRAALSGRLNRLLAKPGFQAWAARFPLTRNLVKRDGAALFNIVAGFCHSQVLMALVELRIPEILLDGPLSSDAIGHKASVPAERMDILLRSGVSLGLLKLRRDNRFALTRQGAALAGVPGLREMILHHKVLYRDLADPVAFFRGETKTELAGFWPYVFGPDGQGDAEVAATYSDLMTQSQKLVAADTLHAVSLSGVKTLLDIGGGTGSFVMAACRATKGMNAILFDLPEVVAAAPDRFAEAGLQDRIRIAGGSFRDDPLPDGADSISLIRVLYDHSDRTVAGLLRKVFHALPPGGRLIVSEPMTGGDTPHRPGDAYFALYTMAMRTGKARSAVEIAKACREAGFDNVHSPRTRRPFITSVVIAQKSSE